MSVEINDYDASKIVDLIGPFLEVLVEIPNQIAIAVSDGWTFQHCTTDVSSITSVRFDLYFIKSGI